MDGIQHRTVDVNGIKMHIAEKGQGPVVLFLHGFPELWYSWRHQILSLSSQGYHAVAPDLRGYGDTDAPPEINSYSCFHIVGDILAMIDTLGVHEFFLVAHDWGAIIGWYLCLFRPDRVKAYVCLSVPYFPRNPMVKPLDSFRAAYGEDFYICRFQAPGEIEALMAQNGTAETLRSILTTRKTGPPILPKEGAFAFNQKDLPSWLREEDISYYASKFEHKGFTGALNYYRCLNLNWELTAPWTGAQVKVPTKFLVGELDMVYTTPAVKEYVNGGLLKKAVPLLEEIVVMEGVAHFNNQEKPDEVNSHIYDFIKKF